MSIVKFRARVLIINKTSSPLTIFSRVKQGDALLIVSVIFYVLISQSEIADKISL